MDAPKVPFLLDRHALSFGVQRWISIDLSMPGVAIVGPSGTGKSVASASLAGTISLFYPDAKLCIVDGKGDPAFRFLASKPGARYFPHRSALDGLRQVNEILNARMAGAAPEPFIYLWLDELMGLLLLYDKKTQEEIRGIVTAISVEGRAMGVQLVPLSVQKPEAVIFGSSAARESLSHILVLGNVTASMAEMTGLDRTRVMPVPSGAVGAGMLLTNGTKQTPVQVPMVRNMERLQQVLLHATTN